MPRFIIVNKDGSLPTGGLAHFEHSEVAAKRFLKEQLNLTAPKLPQGQEETEFKLQTS